MLNENEFFFIPNFYCFQIPYLIKLYNILYTGKNLTRLTNYEKVGEFIQRSTFTIRTKNVNHTNIKFC